MAEEFKVRFSAEDGGLGATAQKTVKQLNEGTHAAQRWSGALGRIGGAFTGGFIASRLTGQARQLLDFAGRISDEAGKLGIDSETIQANEIAGKLSGASAEDLSSGMKKTAVSQTGAVQGNQKLLESYQRLGVSLEDLRTKRPEEIFMQVAAGVERSAPSAQQMTDVLAVMGKSADNLIPAFRAGFATAADEARKAGLVIEESVIQQLDEAGDRMELLGKRLTAAFAPLLAFLVNRLEDVFDLFRIVAGSAGALVGGLVTGGPGEALRQFGEAIDRVADERIARTAGRKTAAPDADPAVEMRELAAKVEELRAKNAQTAAALELAALPPMERVNRLLEERLKLRRLIDQETDPLKREELEAQRLASLKDFRVAQAEADRLNQPEAARPAASTQTDALARVGLYVGARPADSASLQRDQLVKLGAIKDEVASLRREFAAKL